MERCFVVMIGRQSLSAVSFLPISHLSCLKLIPCVSFIIIYARVATR